MATEKDVALWRWTHNVQPTQFPDASRIIFGDHHCLVHPKILENLSVENGSAVNLSTLKNIVDIYMEKPVTYDPPV